MYRGLLKSPKRLLRAARMRSAASIRSLVWPSTGVVAKPILGNVVGGLSVRRLSPLRCVVSIRFASAVKIPIVGIGGIGNSDDVMEFWPAGASAVQVEQPTITNPKLVKHWSKRWPSAFSGNGAASVQDAVGTNCESPIENARSFGNSAYRSISLGQLFWRHSPIHRIARGA